MITKAAHPDDLLHRSLIRARSTGLRWRDPPQRLGGLLAGLLGSLGEPNEAVVKINFLCNRLNCNGFRSMALLKEGSVNKNSQLANNWFVPIIEIFFDPSQFIESGKKCKTRHINLWIPFTGKLLVFVFICYCLLLIWIRITFDYYIYSCDWLCTTWYLNCISYYNLCNIELTNN